MVTTFTAPPVSDYEWIDITASETEELEKLAQKYNLHEESVNDALEPDHLPKFERLKGYIFVIVRVHSDDSNEEADTVRELTDKLSVFISEKFIITVHRNEWKPLEKINQQYVQQGECKNPYHVLNEIVREALMTFDTPAKKLNRTIEYYEEHIFFKNRQVNLLKGIYFLKRKVDVTRRILLLSYDLVDNIDPPYKSDAYTRDIRDLYVKQQSIYDSLSENTNHLLNIYFNVSSQRTNEIIRVLTIFSVFFMPLTFVVGVYGMNFDYMPELRAKVGYPAVMVFMAVIVIAIYAWFKKKKWL
jgi:magnesium transporter